MSDEWTENPLKIDTDMVEVETKPRKLVARWDLGSSSPMTAFDLVNIRRAVTHRRRLIQLVAYSIYETRVAESRPGDELSDWLEAERQVDDFLMPKFRSWQDLLKNTLK